ncbi:hypothetical protein FQN57_000145 [Myotisia sp. PD_48]|nr:hypothetical protein FQN57_000145 [Myotisia sp. PD_48]
MSSASSLSGSHAPSSASDHDESTYLSRGRTLHWTRIALSTVIFVMGVAVVGAESHPLYSYHQTVEYEKWWLSLWPAQLDVSPSVTLITCGTIIFVQNGAYAIVALFPSPRSRILLLNSFMSVKAVTGVVAAVAAVLISVVANNPHYADGGARLGETIYSWTCTWGYAGGVDDITGEKIQAVAGFARICQESRASFTMMCILVALEFASCVLAGAGWWLEIDMNKKRKDAVGAFQGEKHVTMDA